MFSEEIIINNNNLFFSRLVSRFLFIQPAIDVRTRVDTASRKSSKALAIDFSIRQNYVPHL